MANLTILLTKIPKALLGSLWHRFRVNLGTSAAETAKRVGKVLGLWLLGLTFSFALIKVAEG